MAWMPIFMAICRFGLLAQWIPRGPGQLFLIILVTLHYVFVILMILQFIVIPTLCGENGGIKTHWKKFIKNLAELDIGNEGSSDETRAMVVERI